LTKVSFPYYWSSKASFVDVSDAYLLNTVLGEDWYGSSVLIGHWYIVKLSAFSHIS
jgi:hypothetical protein